MKENLITEVNPCIKIHISERKDGPWRVSVLVNPYYENNKMCEVSTVVWEGEYDECFDVYQKLGGLN